jgi:O-antigen/teichoic acid export membrane protein
MQYDCTVVLRATRGPKSGANAKLDEPSVVDERRRAADRYRRIAFTGLGTVVARGISVVTMLVSVPLCLSHLGPERGGLWMTMTALVTVANVGDLGIGNGLMTAIATAHGRGDRRLARQLFASSAAMLGGMSFFLLMLFSATHAAIHWTNVFNVTDVTLASEVGLAMIALALCILVNIPMSLVGRVQLAYQQGYFNSLWESIGNMLSLAMLLAAIKFAAGLPWLVLALAGAPLVATLLNACHLLGWHSPWLRPRRADVNWPAAAAVLRSGGLFFVLQLSVVVLQVSDALLVTHLFGPDRVPELAAPQRLFALPMMALAAVFTPLWPAYAESMVRGDGPWVRKTLARSLLLSLMVGGAAAIGLTSFGGTMLRYWVGPSIPASPSLLIALGIGLVAQAVGSALATLLNAARVVTFQIVVAALLLICKVGMSLALANWLGIAGIAWGTAIAYGCVVLIPYGVRFPRLLKELDARYASPAPRALILDGV